MNWRKLENTFDNVGMFVLIKGTSKDVENGFIHEGAEVYWNDPADETNSTYTVLDCPSDIDDDTIILIGNGYSEAEVYASELEPTENSTSYFYEVGRLGRLHEDLTLTSATRTDKRGIPATRHFDFERNKYWYINIDEIK